jgi:predicted amidohydrolase
LKIALIQLNASNDELWSVSAIPQLLSLAAEADLVVFPECMPFSATNKNITGIDQARQAFCSVGQSGPAFIAGGYLKDGDMTRNAALLIYDGQVRGEYFKRLKWQREPIAPGTGAVKFSWGKHACIPLICADAADNPSPIGVQMMYDALQLGANSKTPIVVPSYGAGLSTEDWREPLSTWARGCGAPVAICGVVLTAHAT